MRAAGFLIALALASGAAFAAPAMSAFAAPEDLAIFGPEVARALAASLERAGIVAAPGALSPGRIEEIDRDRVRLRIVVAGKAVQVEGPLEEIDRLVNELSARVAAALPASARRAPAPGERARAAIPPTSTERAGSPPPHAEAERAPIAAVTPVERKPVASTPVEQRKPVESAPVEREADDAPKAAAPPADEKVERTLPPETHLPATVPATSAAHDEKPPAVEPPRPPPPPPSSPVEDRRGASDAPPPPVYAAPVDPPHRARTPWSATAGRAVLHAIDTPDGCGLGGWATWAAREVLERRLRVQVVATSACGLTRREAALAEAQRFGARAVVMAALESLRLDPVPGGMRPAGRLRIVVLRDGAPVLDRSLEVAGPPRQAPDAARAAYDLVAAGFGLIAGDLGAVLADAR